MNDINVLLGGAEGHNKDSLNYLFTVVKKIVYNAKCKEKLLSITNEYGIVRGFSDKWELLRSIIERL